MSIDGRYFIKCCCSSSVRYSIKFSKLMTTYHGKMAKSVLTCVGYIKNTDTDTKSQKNYILTFKSAELKGESLSCRMFKFSCELLSLKSTDTKHGPSVDQSSEFCNY